MRRRKLSDLKTYDDFCDSIEGTERGAYWHNIVGLTLGQAAKVLGRAEANRLIRECGLDDEGWHEVEAAE